MTQKSENSSAKSLDIELYDAACRCDVSEVSRLLDAGAHPNMKDPVRQETPLHAACRVDSNGSCCRKLLDAGADLQSTCGYGGTCLHQAGQFLMSKALCAVLDAARKGGPELLHQAVDARCKNGWTPLHSSVYKSSSRLNHLHAMPQEERLNIVSALVHAGASLEARADNGETPMETAVAYGCIEGVEALKSTEPLGSSSTSTSRL
eukprot:TRINITY_DN67479_c0_g1_i1.p1 TRINITY_DN67479_c0_g1~~TRINITY_DN67479_c0_g1_i1.p1  ORF type:complete len:206 (+),score=31.21 TRINITY_DN67479_c0_g1_i1:83-700(+)